MLRFVWKNSCDGLVCSGRALMTNGTRALGLPSACDVKQAAISGIVYDSPSSTRSVLFLPTSYHSCLAASEYVAVHAFVVAPSLIWSLAILFKIFTNNPELCSKFADNLMSLWVFLLCLFNSCRDVDELRSPCSWHTPRSPTAMVCSVQYRLWKWYPTGNRMESIIGEGAITDVFTLGRVATRAA